MLSEEIEDGEEYSRCGKSRINQQSVIITFVTDEDKEMLSEIEDFYHIKIIEMSQDLSGLF